MLVQGSLAGDLQLILGSLKLHNLQLQQLEEISQAMSFTGSKLLLKWPCFLVQCPTQGIQLGKHCYAGPQLRRFVTRALTSSSIH